MDKNSFNTALDSLQSTKQNFLPHPRRKFKQNRAELLNWMLQFRSYGHSGTFNVCRDLLLVYQSCKQAVEPITRYSR